MQAIDAVHQSLILRADRLGLAVNRAPAAAQGFGLPAYRQCVVAVNHHFALSQPALSLVQSGIHNISSGRKLYRCRHPGLRRYARIVAVLLTGTSKVDSRIFHFNSINTKSAKAISTTMANSGNEALDKNSPELTGINQAGKNANNRYHEYQLEKIPKVYLHTLYPESGHCARSGPFALKALKAGT